MAKCDFDYMDVVWFHNELKGDLTVDHWYYTQSGQ